MTFISFSDLFHFLGFACVFSASVLGVLVFAQILDRGFAWFVEPNTVIAIIELLCMVFAVFYSVFYFRRFVCEQFSKEKAVLCR